MCKQSSRGKKTSEMIFTSEVATPFTQIAYDTYYLNESRRTTPTLTRQICDACYWCGSKRFGFLVHPGHSICDNKMCQLVVISSNSVWASYFHSHIWNALRAGSLILVKCPNCFDSRRYTLGLVVEHKNFFGSCRYDATVRLFGYRSHRLFCSNAICMNRVG